MWVLTLYDCGFEPLGINAGVLSKYTCELKILLKCVCHMPNVCDWADLLSVKQAAFIKASAT